MAAQRHIPITYISPMPAHTLAAPQPIFNDRHKKNHPVHAEFDGEEFTSTGIGFDDYSRMQTTQHKQSGERRLGTPSWAINFSELQILLARFFEKRAGILIPGDGSPRERIAVAQAKLMKYAETRIPVLEKLCREYTELRKTNSDPERAKILLMEIEGIDTYIRICRSGPGVVARMVFLYYRTALDSVGVAQEVGVRPPLVRQTMYRLTNVWQRMQDGTDEARINHRKKVIGAHEARMKAIQERRAPKGRAPKALAPKFQKVCVICGTEFDGTASRKTCGRPACKRHLHLNLKPKFPKVCPICGLNFYGYKFRITCGDKECKRKYANQQTALRRDEKPRPKGKCVGCGTPYSEITPGCASCKYRYRNYARHRPDFVPRSVRPCRECGCPYDSFTTGCNACRVRRFVRLHAIPKPLRFCKVCGVEFEGHANRKTCSNVECRAKGLVRPPRAERAGDMGSPACSDIQVKSPASPLGETVPVPLI